MSLEVISGHQYLVDPIEGVGGGKGIKWESFLNVHRRYVYVTINPSETLQFNLMHTFLEM